MYVFGHVGVTVAGARAADREVDLRAAALLALAPDLFDKPFRWVFPAVVHGNSRGFGHTLLAWLLVAAVLAAWRPRLKRPGILWACFAGHALLDRIWLGQNLKVFLWPLLGAFPPPMRAGPGFADAFRYDVAGEALGLALIAFMAAEYALRALEREKNPIIGG